MYRGWLAPLGAKHGGTHRAFRGIHVILNQRWREIQGVADIIESKSRGVGREAVRRTDVDAEKVTDGVVVLGTVEPARGNASRIGLDQPILAGKLRFQPARDGAGGFHRRTRHAGGRHLSQPQFLDHLLPDLAVVFKCLRGLQYRQIDIARLDSAIVAGGAVGLNERKDVARFCGQRRANSRRNHPDGERANRGARHNQTE